VRGEDEGKVITSRDGHLATPRLRKVSGDFQVGQKVVCVDDGDADDTGASTGIRYLRREHRHPLPKARNNLHRLEDVQATLRPRRKSPRDREAILI
jgi:hypothetical protein